MYVFWQTLRFIFIDIIGQTLYFPLWWYGQGAWKILKTIGGQAKEFAYSLNLGILFKNLLNPMYGFRDIWSRVISFFVRIVYFFIVLFLTLIWIFILIIFFLLWLALPIFILYNILFQLSIVDFNLYSYLF